MTTTSATRPMRVIYDVLVEDMRDAVRNCTGCYFHFEDGTVTLCPVHDSQGIMDVFDRLVGNKQLLEGGDAHGCTA